MAETSDNTSQSLSAISAEIESLKSPGKKKVSAAPVIGTMAPSSRNIILPNGKPTIIVFLRHCGCPFSEKMFKQLTYISHKFKELRCLAVSHSSAKATERWIPQVGGAWSTDVIIDENRNLYAQWGLGLGNTWHISSPSVLYSMYRLGVDEGVWNRPTEDGTRWQISGAFAVDQDGIVRFAHVCKSADDLPDLQAAAQALGVTVHIKGAK